MVSASHRYTSYEVAVGAVAHVNVAVVIVAMVEPLAGNELVAQPGAVGIAAVVKVVAFALQPTDGPVAFFGTTYQLYRLDAVSPVALYDVPAMVAVAVAGGVAPVHR